MYSSLAFCLILNLFDNRPHRRRTWTVQWYSPGGGSVHTHVIHTFLRPSDSKSQMASRAVQPFLHSSRQRNAILCNGPPLTPSKLPILVGDLEPHLVHGSLGPPKSSTQTASRSAQPFLRQNVATVITCVEPVEPIDGDFVGACQLQPCSLRGEVLQGPVHLPRSHARKTFR